MSVLIPASSNAATNADPRVALGAPTGDVGVFRALGEYGASLRRDRHPGLEAVVENRTETASEVLADGPYGFDLLTDGDEVYGRWTADSEPAALEAVLRSFSAMPTFATHLLVPAGNAGPDADLPELATRVIATALWAFDGEGFVLATYPRA